MIRIGLYRGPNRQIANPLSEKDLVRGCLLDKEDCQREVFRRYAGKMLALCLRYTSNRMEAEDVLQDAFIRVFDKMGSFRNEGSLEGWIRRIVVTTALQNIRSKGYSPDSRGLDAIPEDPIPPAILAHLHEKDLLDLVAALPRGYKIVFNLYAIEGYSHREIAEMLDIGESTSRSQLAKARKMLQEKLLSLHRIAV